MQGACTRAGSMRQQTKNKKCHPSAEEISFGGFSSMHTFSLQPQLVDATANLCALFPPYFLLWLQDRCNGHSLLFLFFPSLFHSIVSPSTFTKVFQCQKHNKR